MLLSSYRVVTVSFTLSAIFRRQLVLYKIYKHLTKLWNNRAIYFIYLLRQTLNRVD